MDIQQISRSFMNAIPSIRTPFSKNGDIDFDSLRRMVEFDIAAGSTSLVITMGDSLFTLLSEQEIVDVTRTVVEQTAGRAAVAACTGYWSTRQCIEFARRMNGIGVDILMLLGSNWYPGACCADDIVTHFKAVADEIPVMANTGYLGWHGHTTGLEVTKRLVDEVPNVIAAKADVTGEYDRKTCLIAGEKWVIFSGGTKQFHLDLHPYGCKGHMATFITFKPEISHKYWNAITKGDILTAVSVIKDFDYPFFELISTLPGGFDAGMHALDEIFSIGKRYRRLPYHSLDDADMDKLRTFFVEKKLLQAISI